MAHVPALAGLLEDQERGDVMSDLFELPEIVKVELEKVQRFLAANNLRYAIQFPDMSVIGNLPVAEEKKRAPRKSYGDLGARVAAMSPYSFISVTVPEGATSDDVVSCASGHGVRHFGKGNFTCRTIDAKTVQCMRRD